MRPEKVYKSNNGILGVGLFFLALIIVSSFLLGEITQRPLASLIFFCFILLVVLYYNYKTSIVIFEDKIVSYAPASYLFYRKKLPFEDVDMILRVKPPVYRGMGDNYITFYSKEGIARTIHEAYYDVSVIKDFLTLVKKKVPNVVLDEQYERLIKGEISCDESFRHRVPVYTEFYNETAYDRYDPLY